MDDMTVEMIQQHMAGFDRTFGFELLTLEAASATARVRVRDELRQPFGLLHGGVFASIAESLSSIATLAGVADRGMVALGQSNSTSFLRPLTEGAVHAQARRLHAGSSTWIWDVECRDDDGRLCAVTRMTIAVRTARASELSRMAAGAVSKGS